MKGVFNQPKLLVAFSEYCQNNNNSSNNVKIEDPYNTKPGDHLQTNYTSQYSYFL